MGFAEFWQMVQDHLWHLWTIVLPHLTVFWERFLHLVIAPGIHREMLWMVLPMAVTMTMMEFYFGRYTNEELGWNTAVGNSIVLIFVSIDLFRQITRQLYSGDISQVLLDQTSVPVVLVIASVVGLLGAWLLIVDFFHILPKKLAFKISSSLPINLVAYVAIVVVYTNLPSNNVIAAIPIDWYTPFAAVFLFILLLAVFKLMKLVEPKAKDLFYDHMYTKATAEFEEVIDTETKELQDKLEEVKKTR